ncbi:RNA methyltransferase [Labilibaculum sp.]|uniref:TrmH family RNA methyltransferase n=1 Tax=Labilibaculum sp. TaxID=2060723 RepID=UPI002AA90FF6|nr:RNA methyltransferase [Labilibaculum sp.]MBN2596613.1 RNA methyltransferase [Marinifilaceae bacterium]
MLSKNQIKLITSLQQKKYRDQHQLFVAEGNKLVSDLIEAKTEVEFLIYTKEWKECNSVSNKAKINNRIETDVVQIKKISSLKTPSSVIAVFKIPSRAINETIIQNSLSLVLDDVQDPGNLGTIIRVADWFGIKHLFCSPNTVDLYNPKVIQATMGAISSVTVIYTPLEELILKYKTPDFPIYGTFLEGEIIYNCQLQKKGFIIMGNEGKGVSETIQKLVSNKLYIPDFPSGQAVSESLNVSVATSIICSEFRRQEF